MKLKKLGMALVVIFALSAVAAGNALAAAVTEDVPWTIENSVLTGTETVSATGSGELITEIGTTKLKLKASGIECLECKIENSGGTAVGTGKLRFTGVTVVEPATCAVEGGSITTVDLRVKADYMIGTTNYIKFEPEEGTNFATFKLIKGSGSCAISGTYSVSGSEFVQSNNGTDVLAVNQGVTASGSINTTAGGALFLGSKPAELNGTASFALSGANKGKKFATN